MLSFAGPRLPGGTDTAASFDKDGAAVVGFSTPIRNGRDFHLVQRGLLTPPETPRDEIIKKQVTAFTAAPVLDPFTPPATPGDWPPVIAGPTAEDEVTTASTSTTLPRARVRFVSPTRSSSGPSSEPETSSAETGECGDFDDTASTVSSFSEHGISRPSSPEPTSEPDLSKLSEFELWTRHYDQRLPKRARLACAQCLRLGLPCDRSMPSCSRCARRQRQLELNALSSPMPCRTPSAADACCVPMLYTKDSEHVVRPIPIFKTFSECLADLPWGADLEAAKADLEARRRAAYDAIVAEDEERAARLNWVFPRAGAAALGFSGRIVEQRLDGTVVLKRTAGIDGCAKVRLFTTSHPLRSPISLSSRSPFEDYRGAYKQPTW